MNLKYLFAALMLSFISCDINSNEEIEKEARFLSIENSEEIRGLKVRLTAIMEEKFKPYARNSTYREIVDMLNWGVVRKLHNETNDYDVYTMVLEGIDGVNYSNLIIFDDEGELWPYVFSFYPDSEWSKNPNVIQTSPFKGEVVITSVMTGKEYSSNNGESSEGRMNFNCVTTWVEVNNNYWDVIDGQITLVVLPPSFYPVTVCESNGNEALVFEEFIDGIDAAGPGPGPVNEIDPVYAVIIPEEEVPCAKDPVPYPTIVPQTNSGMDGGMFGCNRNGAGCTTGGVTYPNKKWHGGVDLANSYGSPVYNMYTGTIYSVQYDVDGAGYHTRVQSTVNGETFIVDYFHMQEHGRITSVGQFVLAGQILGYQGASGNLGGAIYNGYTNIHLHVEVRVHDGSSSWSFLNNFTPADPRDYLSTEISDNGNSYKSEDCSN